MSAQVTDPGLPQLALALAPEALTAVATTAGIDRPPSASDGRVELLKHVPGQRATISYTFGHQTEAPVRVIAKLYRSGRRAARMLRWLEALNRDVFPADEHVRVPSPIGLVEDLRMVLHRYIQGVDLRHVLGDKEGVEPLQLAARWLARLHSSRPLDELKVRSVDHEIEKALRWLEQVHTHVSDETKTHLSQARARLDQGPAELATADLRTIHRDYYYANLLWDGASVWAIDLDQLRIGDPAFDVGHFLAHLGVLSYRQTGRLTAFAEHADTFLCAYLAEAGSPALEARLPLYRAYTFLKLAATDVQRERPDWREAADALAGAACDEIEQL